MKNQKIKIGVIDDAISLSPFFLKKYFGSKVCPYWLLLGAKAVNNNSWLLDFFNGLGYFFMQNTMRLA